MEIEKVMIPIEKIINNSEECFAHVAKDNKQKETLKEHTERCQKYWKNLVEKKNLMEILEEFEKRYFNSAGEKVKEIFESMTVNIVTMHDIGKVNELSDFPENDYTDDGQLLGHIVMGVEMIGSHIREIPGFPPVLASELKHCILAHHGEFEYGSPKKPAIIEAAALNFADNADAKLEIMKEQLASATPGEWIGFNRLMDSNIKKTVLQ